MVDGNPAVFLQQSRLVEHGGRLVDRNAEEPVVWDDPVVGQRRCLGGGIERGDLRLGPPADVALLERFEDPADASSEIGIGLGIGLITLMVLADRRPFFSRKSCNMMAVSKGAAGHLKKGPSTPMMASPPSKAGSTSRTRLAPSTE